jgi:hypothetical protein
MLQELERFFFVTLTSFYALFVVNLLFKSFSFHLCIRPHSCLRLHQYQIRLFPVQPVELKHVIRLTKPTSNQFVRAQSLSFCVWVCVCVCVFLYVCARTWKYTHAHTHSPAALSLSLHFSSRTHTWILSLSLSHTHTHTSTCPHPRIKFILHAFFSSLLPKVGKKSAGFPSKESLAPGFSSALPL